MENYFQSPFDGIFLLLKNLVKWWHFAVKQFIGEWFDAFFFITFIIFIVAMTFEASNLDAFFLCVSSIEMETQTSFDRIHNHVIYD